ncbi:uncharacterized protein TNIN_54431 [Trichonephila inaurata madagascariensis]|uniref:Uncharacterized protein n=1 Tax=Trichonephila inaurata madagascariensis TaxID=2747483 RepID=A0A8X7CSW4_9ARAC|nr:uncharacterized protein TNIN_54431 [Trichonephila inaurata madagascariensis]
MSSILHGAGANAAKAFRDLYDLWFDEQGNKTQYLKTLEKEGVNLSNMSSILGGTGTKAVKAFKGLYGLWFDKQGNKMQYLKTLKKEGVDLLNISSILSGTGANAAKAFRDLYDLWFDEEGNKTQYLKTLEKEGISPANISSILSKAGTKAPKVFKGLYDLWFDKQGNKTQYLKTLEKEGINLSNMSSILHGAGANAVEAFKELYNTFCDEQGSKTQHLKRFIKKKDGEKEVFTLHNLSGILSKAGANAKDAFEKLHSVCFNDEGKKTELLDDFYNAGFRPRNLSCMLCGAGVRAASILKRLHSVCFNEKRERTKLLDDFHNAGFRLCDLCNILSAAADSLEEFHNFCFIGETKEYLSHFLNEKEGFTPKNLSKILHGAGANICSALKDFHDICFDETENKTPLLADFHNAGFTPSNLSNILSMAGNNAASILRNFHKLCFNKENYLNHFLAEEELFTSKAGIKGVFAVHLVTSNHVIAIYRTDDNYTYFDTNAAFVSGLKSVDQLMQVVEKRVESAGYKVEGKGFLIEHFDVARANNQLPDEDKQVLTKEIKTERHLLAEQDKELGLIKINGQEVSRVQLYDFGTKINVEGGVPLLINADMNLSSKKFQDHLDKKEVSMTTREYLDSLKNSKNIEEVVQATKSIKKSIARKSRRQT